MQPERENVRTVVYAAAFSPGAACNNLPCMPQREYHFLVSERIISSQLLCTADGQQIVVAAGARVFLYDLDGNPVHALKGHTVRSYPSRAQYVLYMSILS